MAATKAVVGFPIKDGGALMGCLAALKDLQKQFVDDPDNNIYCTYDGEPLEDFISKVCFGEKEGDFDASLLEIAFNYVEGPVSANAPSLKGGNLRTRELEPVAITSLGGKVRVITKHPPIQVTLARHFMGTWVKILKQYGPAKAILSGLNPRLSIHTTDTNRPCFFFSADLSKATDLIPHDVAMLTAFQFADRFFPGSDGNPDWITRNVKDLFDLKTITFSEENIDRMKISDYLKNYLRAFNGVDTTTGIHMGLGPTWIVLSLLNIGCALRAGASLRSFAVCGDDLIGWWPTDIINRYKANIRECGLEINDDKSFISKTSGVFCEGLVEVQTATSAEVKWHEKMAEYYSAQWRNFQQGKPEKFLSAAASAPKGAPIRQQFLRRPRGPVELGFGGDRRATRKDLRKAFYRGARPLASVRQMDYISKDIKNATISVSQRQKGDMDISIVQPFLERFAKRRRALNWVNQYDPSEHGTDFNKYVNGSVNYLSLQKFKSMAPRGDAPKMPKRIRMAISHRPWTAARLITRFYQKKTFRPSLLKEIDPDLIQIALADGTIQHLSDLAKPTSLRGNDLLKRESIHPILRTEYTCQA
jgi:hypothetical protein